MAPIASDAFPELTHEVKDCTGIWIVVDVVMCSKCQAVFPNEPDTVRAAEAENAAHSALMSGTMAGKDLLTKKLPNWKEGKHLR